MEENMSPAHDVSMKGKNMAKKVKKIAFMEAPIILT